MIREYMMMIQLLVAVDLDTAVAQVWTDCRSVWTEDPSAADGNYFIDLDGREGSEQFEVECMRDGNQSITILHHSQESKSKVTTTQPESWNRTLNYEASLQQLQAVILGSAFCYQEIIFDCHGVQVLEYGGWLGGDGEWHKSVGAGTTDGMCGCSVLQACAHPSHHCNCNGERKFRSDRGRITENLPVLELALGGALGVDTLNVTVSALKCSESRPIDIPRSCQEAREQLGLERNDVVLIDVDGAEGDADGNMDPFQAFCDVESYRHVAVTQIPHNQHRGGMSNAGGQTYRTVTSSGNLTLLYAQPENVMRKLIAQSAYCSQDIGYRCKNSALLGSTSGFWSSLDGTKRHYWGSSGGRDGQCACGVTGRCQRQATACNCHIMDGKTRQDFGVLTNKEHLPVGYVTFNAGGWDRHGEFYVGWLGCASSQFGIEPSCQWYRAKDWDYSYSYMIDPDGPLPGNPTADQIAANVQPFTAHCEFLQDAVLGMTMFRYNNTLPQRSNLADPIELSYPGATAHALKALTSRSSYCTQEIAWHCRMSPVHKQGENMVYWENLDGEKINYLHGSAGDACQCDGDCNNFPYKCHCDANSNISLVDKGLLVNKNDLPVVKLYPQLGGYFELGPLKCYEVRLTCSDFVQHYEPTPEQPRDHRPGRWAIDPDGPIGVEPFSVFCRGEETVVFAAGNESVRVLSNDQRRPEDFAGPYKNCYNITYNLSRQKLRALTEASPFCSQYANYECIRAPYTSHVKWISRELGTMTGWAGNPGSDECMCGDANRCQGSRYSHCNCDAYDGTERADGGRLVDKHVLPVWAVCMGYGDPSVGRRRMAAYQLGAMHCSPRKSAPDIYQSCQRLRDQLPQARSGVYLLDPGIRCAAAETEYVQRALQGYDFEPFVAYCDMLSDMPLGVTEISPTDPSCWRSNTWLDITYNRISLDQIDGVKHRSTYCFQEIFIKCAPDQANFSLSSFPAYYDRHDKKRYMSASIDSRNCPDDVCLCDNGWAYLRLWETSKPTFLSADVMKGTLPITRLNPGRSAECVNVGIFKCFDVQKDCADVKASGQSTNRMSRNRPERYVIDPDGADGVGYFPVTCDFLTNEDHPLTVVSHNIGRVAMSNGYTDYIFEYDGVTIEQLQALKTGSQFCKQEVEYYCSGVPLLNDLLEPYAQLLDVSLVPMSRWAGADITTDPAAAVPGCACSQLDLCPPNKTCRCDALQPSNENGVVLNMTYLPLTGFKYGGVMDVSASNHSNMAVGSFVCAQATILPGSCAELQAENRAAGEYTLLINGQYQLTYCDLTAPDGCESSPCENDGVCSDGDGVFLCTCPLGFSGDRCEIVGNSNECSSTPCMNAGTCEDRDERFECICAPGYEGRVCETDIDECGNYPCRNLGSCVQGSNSFTCYCMHGYEGDTCEIGMSGCGSQSCNAAGTVMCLENVDRFNCFCKQGFQGESCHIDIDECSSGPCPVNSTCVDRPGYYDCVCPMGLIGHHCERLEQRQAKCISPSPCKNGGVCIELFNNKYDCNCSGTGYGGTNCSVSQARTDSSEVRLLRDMGYQVSQAPKSQKVTKSGYALILIVMGLSDVIIMVWVLMYFCKKRQREVQLKVKIVHTKALARSEKRSIQRAVRRRERAEKKNESAIEKGEIQKRKIEKAEIQKRKFEKAEIHKREIEIPAIQKRKLDKQRQSAEIQETESMENLMDKEIDKTTYNGPKQHLEEPSP